MENDIEEVNKEVEMEEKPKEEKKEQKKNKNGLDNIIEEDKKLLDRLHL